MTHDPRERVDPLLDDGFRAELQKPANSVL
jgi:hypothetical protein